MERRTLLLFQQIEHSNSLLQGQFLSLVLGTEGSTNEFHQDSSFVILHGPHLPSGFPSTQTEQLLRWRWDIRKSCSLVRHWNRLPREIVTALSLLVFKKHQDDTHRLVFTRSRLDNHPGSMLDLGYSMTLCKQQL